jgi:beta-lactamase superfamily II metal-dependent hydrolase
MLQMINKIRKSKLLLGCFFFWLLRNICFASGAVELSVFEVGQANFTICVVGNGALVFDCGTAETAKWVGKKGLRKVFLQAKEIVIRSLLNGIRNVAIVISHDHTDHRNLVEALQEFCKRDGKCFRLYEGWTLMTEQNGETMQAISNFLGENVNITPLLPLMRERLRPAEPHDNNLVLRVELKRGGPAILLTGDASKNLLDSIDPRLLSGVGVLMLSHHGSDASNELEWFRRVKEQNAGKSVLYLISSDPRGKDHIPVYETVRTMLSELPNIYASVGRGGYYCADHCVDVWAEKVLEMPVYDNFGIMAPVFITSQAAKRGDGIFRIELTRKGWGLRDTPRDDTEMSLEDFSQNPDRGILRNAMSEEISSAVQRQTEAISKVRQEALNILPSQRLYELGGERRRSEDELRSEGGLLQKLSNHIEQGERMVAKLAERAKQSKMTRIKFEIASGFLQGIRNEINFFSTIIPPDRIDLFHEMLFRDA